MNVVKETKPFIEKKVVRPNKTTTACCCCCCGGGGNLRQDR